MASFAMEDFVGNGSLKALLPKLLYEGWDDVPTLKLMKSEDMEAINMTQQHKDVLEIRTYLHDHALMQYADKLEASGKSLSELLNLNTRQLSCQYGMKRGHVARLHRTMESRTEPLAGNLIKAWRQSIAAKSAETSSAAAHDVEIKEGNFFKGIVAAMPAEPAACGCIRPPPVADEVAPYSTIKNIPVQRLTPEYKVGTQRLVQAKSHPMKASDLWSHKPAVLLCIRRPGCIMCRADAYRLYSQKPTFDALGIQLFAIIHERIDSEVQSYWPRYWGGAVLYDKEKRFFKALGGGKLLKDNFMSSFLFNPQVIANFKRSKAMGMKLSMKGEDIKGGLFIVGTGNTGIAYQFIERNFGDWAPLSEVVEICTKLQKVGSL